MLKNYLLTSLRSLKKDKFYVSVNLLSLAMAFALCTIGFFNFMFNHTYNKSFVGYDSIYKINAKPKSITSSKEVGISPLALADAMSAQFPNLAIGRFHKGNLSLKVDHNFFSESVGFVDNSFLNIINFDVQPLHLALDEIIITEEVAVRLFNEIKDANGKLLEVYFPDGGTKLLKVTRVIPAQHSNTSFKFSILLSIAHYIDSEERESNPWKDWISGTFLMVDEAEKESVTAALQTFLTVQNEANAALPLAAYQLDKIAEWAHFERELQGRSFGAVLHPASVVGTMSSAFAILLLACFNFFNTTIATSGNRLKEISMRKIIGGQRKDIITQFMLESAIQVMVAFLLSLIIAKVLIGPYHAMFRFELIQFQPDYLEPYLLFAVGVCLLTIILSGAYPALYISRFSSLDILKKKTKFKGNGLLTRALLAVQFAVCAYNIFGLGVFVENAYYQENLDRGYDVRNFINLPLKPSQYHALNNELSQASGFEGILGTKDLVGFSDREVSFQYDGVAYTTGKLEVGEGYLSGLGVDFVQGQDFIADRASNERLILVNETFEDQIGDNMLGKWVTIAEKKYRVNGVTADFNLKTIMLSNKIKPTIFFFAADSSYGYAVIKCDQNRLVEENKKIEQIWYQRYPQELYGGFFQEEVFENVNTTNRIMVRINSFIAVVSILISILGLYALISLTVQRRIKEIGIRKTLGASFAHVLRLLLKEITWMIAIAILLGLMVGSYFIDMLLDIIYAYHIEIDSWNYLFSIAVILFAAVISIGFKVIRTARMNPVAQLRVE